MLDRAIELREEQPARTTPTLVDLLKHDPAVQLAHPLNVHTLTTHLRRRGKTRRLLAQSATAFRRFERDHVNDLWQGDALVGPWLPDPAQPGRKRRAHLFCFIDDHSRLVPYAEFFFEEALPRMERVLKIGILRRGLPKAIYVDNGQVYSATQFGVACATLGIHRIHTAPYSPEGRGKQERFFETLRLQFLPEVEASDITTPHGTQRILVGLAGMHLPRPGALRDRPDAAGPLHRRAGPDAHTSSQRPCAGPSCGASSAGSPRPPPFAARQSLPGRSALAGRNVELRFDPFDLVAHRVVPRRPPQGVATVTSKTASATWPSSAWPPSRPTHPGPNRRSISWPPCGPSTRRSNRRNWAA